ncbi:MAG: hypothetical protein U1D41_08120 [Nitrosomonas sp.]|uniref:TPR end-of-group domain-containing protein n=1 Tax=Nitrosomonas sp. TaxID=42353 RepID=UPI002736CDF8|nr:hypothetical protein [Nitrosomonas sp.]MDP3663992.1 hypothetical protein [Nitrosomonas sp.]MDZ4106113.1 hypothetical protein [Nitrosomonas sp.]
MAIISRIPHSIIFCFLAILLCGSITPVYSQTTEPESSQQKIANSETVIDEVKRSLQRLEDKERQNYERELEGQRKNIDWLFSALTVVIGIVAFMGVFAPFMMFQSNRKQMQGMLDEVKEVAEKIRLHEESAKQSVVNTQQYEHKAKELTEKLEHYKSGQSPSKIESQELTEAAEQIQHDPQFDPQPGLRAAAVAASIEDQPEKAYKLWEAVAELDADDANALFNAGYWAQKKAESFQGGEAIKWLNVAGERYRRALSIKPDLHEAENNWGSALAKEAKELAKSNLFAASKLWQEANEKFQRALSIKPDFHVAIDNWGSSSLDEANAIAATDGDKANELRNLAERLLLPLALSAPELVAYNLACVYGQRGDVSNCLHWLKTAQTHNKLVSCEHLQTDADLDAVRNHPDFQAWLQLVCPH